MTPKVDTFEHDIANEIRRKEANLAEIQAVSQQNSPNIEATEQRKLPWLTIILAILLVLSLVGIGAVAYYYFNDSLLPPSSQEVVVTKKDIPKVTAELTKLSPTLNSAIGRFVSSVEKKDAGYILTINNYSEVFGYMIRNENESVYIDELASVFSKSVPLSSSTPQVSQDVPATTSPQSITQLLAKATSSATSTKSTTPKPAAKSATTTKVTATSSILTLEPITLTQDPMPIAAYQDITIENQNMRVFKKGNTTIIYAFVGDTTILIADSQEKILALRGAILR